MVLVLVNYNNPVTNQMKMYTFDYIFIKMIILNIYLITGVTCSAHTAAYRRELNKICMN